MTEQALDLAFADSFHKALTKLSPLQMKHVHEAIQKLKAGYAATHLHALKGLPFLSFGVNQDAYRVICKKDGALLILLHVGDHDAAYRWAEQHRMVQVGTTVRIIRTVEVEGEGEGGATSERPPGPLAHLRDRELARFEIGPAAAKNLRRIEDETELLEVAEQLRVPLGEAILVLGTDLDALADALRAYEEGKRAPKPPPELAEALVAPENRERFFVLPPGEDELERALGGSLDAWQVFLHRSQRRLVEKDVDGAMRVTGGPGTGKTVVALHRARHLAENLLQDDERPILVTTFNRVLAARLRGQLAHLCGESSRTLERIRVDTLVGVSQDILRRAGETPAFLTDADETACWEEAMGEGAVEHPRSFYEAERELVLARHDVWTEDAYFENPRPGRGKPMARRERRAVWKVLDAFETAMRRRGGLDRLAFAREAARLVRDGTVSAPYAAIVCDEAQDMTAADLRLAAALARADDGERTRRNALFLAGDGYQRIYRAPVPLSHCGIDIRGRSWRLRLNYRTTEGIRVAALKAIQELPPDEFHPDQHSARASGDRSLRAGPRPEEHTFASKEQEADWIAARLAESPQETTLVLARTHGWLEDLETLLRSRGAEVMRVAPEDEALPSRGAALSTLHRAKGLEAPGVIIAGAQLIPYRRPSGEPEAHWKRKERCLLYVGMTRARDRCAVTRVVSEKS